MESYMGYRIVRNGPLGKSYRGLWPRYEAYKPFGGRVGADTLRGLKEEIRRISAVGSVSAGDHRRARGRLAYDGG